MGLNDFLYLTTIGVLVVIGYSHIALTRYLKRHSTSHEKPTSNPLVTVGMKKPNGTPRVIARTEAQEAEIEEKLNAKKGWD